MKYSNTVFIDTYLENNGRSCHLLLLLKGEILLNLKGEIKSMLPQISY